MHRALNVLSAVCLTVLAVASTGCMTDNAVTLGGASASDGGATSGGDGSVSGGGSDAIVVNPVDGGTTPPPSDAGTTPEPGVDAGVSDGGTGGGSADAGPAVDGGPAPAGSCQGLCGQYQKNAACQCDPQCKKYGDCCPDFDQICASTGGGGGGGGGGKCGNGQCDAGETTQSCPQDCPNVPQLLSCMEKSCVAQWSACDKNAECQKVLECLKSCTDTACLQTCTANVSQSVMQTYLGPLGQCAQQAGCLTQSPPPNNCGNGKCDKGESPQNCPQDCTGGPGTQCGNGQCDKGETAQSCPQDCGGGNTGGVTGCFKQNCSKELGACLQDQQCAQVVVCAQSCADLTCVAKCAQTADPSVQQKLVLPLGQCGQQFGCFNQTTPPSTVCGDGKCDAGESATTCPKDCPLPPPANPVEQCLADKCTKSWPACAASPECYKAAQCLEAGGSVMQCVPNWTVGQQISNLVNCGNKNGCFSNTGGGSTAKCGDGICTASAGESSTTCPADCGPALKPCKAKSDCADTEVCCAQGAGNVCVPVGKCN